MVSEPMLKQGHTDYICVRNEKRKKTELVDCIFT